MEILVLVVLVLGLISAIANIISPDEESDTKKQNSSKSYQNPSLYGYHGSSSDSSDCSDSSGGGCDSGCG